MGKSLKKIETPELRINTTNYGARLVTVEVLQAGVWVPVCAGFQDLDLFERPDFQYFGATVGRVAGRLAEGVYRSDGLNLRLEKNENTNHLHGGLNGAIHNREWQLIEHGVQKITYGLLSKDGEGGFPGNLKIRVEYRVEGSVLTMLLEAETDRATPVNLTNHGYWNLSGSAASASEHELEIRADAYVPVDAQLLPTGPSTKVSETEMDFTKLKSIGSLGKYSTEPEPGFDHLFLLRKAFEVRQVATLRHPGSGITMHIATDSEALQFYSGNRNPSLSACLGMRVEPGNTICLEAVDVNDPPVIGDYQTITLLPGDKFSRTVKHSFSV